MKKKILVIIMITILLFANYSMVWAAIAENAFIRSAPGTSGVKSVYENAALTNQSYLPSVYNAKSLTVDANSINFYKYNTNTKITPKGNIDKSQMQTNAAAEYNQNDNGSGYLTYTISNNEDAQELQYSLKIKNDAEVHYSNVLTVIYTKALRYNGKVYDVQLNINGIDKYGEGTPLFNITRGTRKREVVDETATDPESKYKDVIPESRKFVISQYTDGLLPWIGTNGSKNTKMYVSCEYKVLESGSYEKNAPKEVGTSGIWGFRDLDHATGFFVEGASVVGKNDTGKTPTLYTTQATLNKDEEEYGKGIGNIYYKATNANGKNGTFFYNVTNTNTGGGGFHLLMPEATQINFVKTYDYETNGEASAIEFNSSGLLRYNMITTEVVGPGKITSTSPTNLNQLENGSNAVIKYAPDEGAYLKEIIIDEDTENERSVSITEFANQYTFSNIQEDHTIKVVYGTRYNVTFDPKGGTPTPDTQKVMPNENASEPTTDPTKNGYRFEGWNLKGESTPYDFDTPVTQDITLEAQWDPIVYNIIYELDGGTNDPDNPGTYTVEDTVTFKNPTKPGYIFDGWYTDSTFKTPITEIPLGSTGDKTIYAKWEADVPEEANYVVRHYKETKDGEYELATTDELQDEVGKEVLASPKTYKGYHENKTHEDRVPSAVVLADGSTELRLYYDRDDCIVTFKPENGENDTKQTVPYEDNAEEIDEPEKEGYEFDGWFYGNTRYDFDSPVTQDITLTAKWTPVQSESDGKKDDTVAKDSSLPQTGQFNPLLAISLGAVLVFGGVFIIGYIKAKKNIK